MFIHGVRDQHHDSACNRSQRLPALLAVHDAIQNTEGKRVREDELGGLETDLVLRQIAPAFLLIPDESHHASSQYCMYILICTVVPRKPFPHSAQPEERTWPAESNVTRNVNGCGPRVGRPKKRRSTNSTTFMPPRSEKRTTGKRAKRK